MTCLALFGNIAATMNKRTKAAIDKRTKRHGSKARLSRATGIPLPYLSRILKGERVPGAEKAELLERELELSPGSLRSAR